MTVRLLVAIVAIPVAAIYAGGLLIVAIAGYALHRVRLEEMAKRIRMTPLAALLTCALLWPFLLARVVQERRHG